MQKVWRGERPQAGRFREFVQCDIDVINVDKLPIHFDAEMPAIIWETLSSLPGMEDQNIQIQISNRKILIGLLQALEVENITEVTRWIDKLDKMDENAVRHELSAAGLTSEQIDPVLKLAKLKTRSGQEVLDYIKSMGIENEMLQEGAEELAFVIDQLKHLPEGAVIADLSIVRGLDYYTGTVYETRFIDDPNYGSICSGGRYDDLASHYINKKLPGVGISIGFTRLFDRLRTQGAFEATRTSPADVLVVLPSEDRRQLSAETAQTLRARGFNVEQYHAPQKIGKQLAYAQKKGIPHVWFPPFDDEGVHEVKDMASGEQGEADAREWIIKNN